MKTKRRLSSLENSLNQLQIELGRGKVEAAQRLAADLAGELENWHFDLLHIPTEERRRYRTQNPYYRPY